MVAATCALPCAQGRTADLPRADVLPLSVPFYLEGRLRGMVQMLVTPDPRDSYVQAAPVLQALRPLLAEEKIQAMEAKISQGFLRLKDGVGVSMAFDEVLVAIVATIPAESKKQQPLRARAMFDPSTRTITPPSALSAYLNAHGSQDYVEHPFPGQDAGRLPFRLSTDGAVNLRGWVLEGSADYVEQDPAHPWARGDVRGVYDWPSEAIRAAAGDLSYPVEGFQSFQPMLGATVARDFDLQPYRVTEPTGQTSFFLKSPSRVDVFVNGQKVRTLQLEPGPYSIRDFPVVSGANEVTLVITDATGRVETRTLDIVTDVNLLAAGLHKYAYNAGVVSQTDARGRTYDASLPVFSGFHRYGLAENLTLGANLQADREQQLGGFDVTLGHRWGAVRADLAASHAADAGGGLAWRLQYQNIDNVRPREDGAFKGTRTFALLASYRDRTFAPLGNALPDNASSYELAARYGWQWSPTLSIGMAGSYRMFRDNRPDDWGATVSFNERLSRGFNLGLNLGLRQVEGVGVFLTLSWMEPGSRHSVSSSYDSFTRTARADWNYAQDGRAESVSASSSVIHTDSREAVDGNITYFGNRGEIAARQDVTAARGDSEGAQSGTDTRSQLRFGSALVYSDGHVALSRPVSNSFALFVPDPAIAAYPIGINPRGRTGTETRYETKTERSTPAVVPDLTPYIYRTFRIDASRLPPGFDAGEGSYTLYPGYRSGTVVRLGSDANVMADGTLVFSDGAPVALQAGSIRPVAEPDALPQAFFTNRAGRFRIDKLKPGRYAMQIFSVPGATLLVDIPAGAAGPTPIGVLVLPATPER